MLSRYWIFLPPFRHCRDERLLWTFGGCPGATEPPRRTSGRPRDQRLHVLVFFAKAKNDLSTVANYVLLNSLLLQDVSHRGGSRPGRRGGRHTGPWGSDRHPWWRDFMASPFPVCLLTNISWILICISGTWWVSLQSVLVTANLPGRRGGAGHLGDGRGRRRLPPQACQRQTHRYFGAYPDARGFKDTYIFNNSFL